MIVVFGSLNVDMVLEVENMPTPGDTILCNEYKLFPGGKGANQAVAAAKAGASVKMYGSIGPDNFGQIACSELKKVGVDISGVITQTKPTGCATICVDKNGENMITVASGANLDTKAEIVPDTALIESTTVVLQMETPSQQNFELINRAAAKGSKVILNLAPAKIIPEDVLKKVSVLIVNELEANVLALNLGFDVISAHSAAKKISTMFKITCVVTVGSKGAYVCHDDESWHVNAMEIKPIDTTAAGDSFVGALAAYIDKGGSIEKAIHFASVASGLTCCKIGAQPSLPTLAEIESSLSSVPKPTKVTN